MALLRELLLKHQKEELRKPYCTKNVLVSSLKNKPMSVVDNDRQPLEFTLYHQWKAGNPGRCDAYRGDISINEKQLQTERESERLAFIKLTAAHDHNYSQRTNKCEGDEDCLSENTLSADEFSLKGYLNEDTLTEDEEEEKVVVEEIDDGWDPVAKKFVDDLGRRKHQAIYSDIFIKSEPHEDKPNHSVACKLVDRNGDNSITIKTEPDDDFKHDFSLNNPGVNNVDDFHNVDQIDIKVEPEYDVAHSSDASFSVGGMRIKEEPKDWNDVAHNLGVKCECDDMDIHNLGVKCECDDVDIKTMPDNNFIRIEDNSREGTTTKEINADGNDSAKELSGKYDGNSLVINKQKGHETAKDSSMLNRFSSNKTRTDKEFASITTEKNGSKFDLTYFEEVRSASAGGETNHGSATDTVKVLEFVCRWCSYRSCDLSSLQRHYSVSNTCAKPYTCNSCPKRYSRLEALKSHHSMAHERKPVTVRLYTCDKCGFSTTAISSLILHQKQHVANRKKTRNRKKCSNCGKWKNTADV